VVEVGGVGTLPQSMQAVGQGGEIALIGVLTKPQGDLNPHILMLRNASLRGMLVGGQHLFVELLAALGSSGLKPVIDSVFEFDDAPRAYERLQGAQHFGKVVIRI
jgi:D-arabinose 1-dehydrogenase-like Zn-dependent alcohol dehydrogenase